MKPFLEAMIRGEVQPPPVAKLIGMELTHVEEGAAIFELEAGEQHHNPMGTLHGGVLCDLADGAMGVSFASTLDEGETFTTLELKMNFVRPFWVGRLRAHGRVVDRGRTVGLADCRVVDEKDRLIAYATSTCMVLRGEKAEGRRAG